MIKMATVDMSTVVLIYTLFWYQNDVNALSCPSPAPCHCDLSIHCEGQSLTQVPSSLLLSPPSPTDDDFYTFNLRMNSIQTVSKDSFKNYPIHGIDLSHNPISHIDDDAFLNLSGQLLELNLESTGIKYIPSSVANLTSLRKLNIKDNPIAVIRPAITTGIGQTLISLMFGGTRISYWPVALNFLVRLETLDMSHNKVSFLRTDAVNAFAYTLLDLRLVNCSLATFQPSLRNLKVLQNLDLSHNVIQDIPKGSFQNIANSLKHFSLTHGDLSYLPEALEDLSTLVDLDLSHNPMVSTNQDILGSPNTGPNPLFAKMANTLTTLRLASTRLFAIPLAVKDLRALRMFDFSGNGLMGLDNYQFSSLVKVSEMNLNNNPLTSIPYLSFSGMTSLTTLTLANCSMSYVPSGAISQLKALLFLDLSNNRIHQLLEHAFPNSQRLSTVDLSGNSFTTISDHAFDDATTLRTLKLDRCQLKNLPQGLQNGHGLRTVELYNNAIQCTCDSLGWVRQWQAATGVIPHLLGHCDNDHTSTIDHYIIKKLVLCPGSTNAVG